MSDDKSSFAELDALTTEQLREKAFDRAQEHRDVGFFWDLIKHLRGGGEIGSDDGSAGGLGESITGVIDVVNELLGHHDSDLEPLLRARYIDYLQS
ncbi:MAG: hypothetical protein JO214_07595 [Frankiaceae bacterium]|nr:hypothetical protein [Frankiaceae bacterium]